MSNEYQDLLIKVATSKDEAIKELAMCDHAIVDGKFARAMGKAFGVDIQVGSIQDTRSEFKGATIDGAEEGEVVEDMMDASQLATQLCDKLDVDYMPMHGRGSQLRSCVTALKGYIAKAPALTEA